MKTSEFISKLLDIVNNYNTVYMWGTFGQPVTQSLIDSKTKQYPYWYTPSKQMSLKFLIGKNYYAFDCIGLIKGILWGWKDNLDYRANGVPDLSADGMISICLNTSPDFSKIEIGEVVWTHGHIGVYIGNKKVIECTPSWENGVQITNLTDRDWIKHGKLPYIAEDDIVIFKDVVICKENILADKNMSEIYAEKLNCPVITLNYVQNLSTKQIENLAENIYQVGIPNKLCNKAQIIALDNRWATAHRIIDICQGK